MNTAEKMWKQTIFFVIFTRLVLQLKIVFSLIYKQLSLSVK